MKCRCEIYSCY